MEPEDVLVKLYRTEVHSGEYKYFCIHCMAQFEEHPVICPFCNTKEFKENTLEDFANCGYYV